MAPFLDRQKCFRGCLGDTGLKSEPASDEMPPVFSRAADGAPRRRSGRYSLPRILSSLMPRPHADEADAVTQALSRGLRLAVACSAAVAGK